MVIPTLICGILGFATVAPSISTILSQQNVLQMANSTNATNSVGIVSTVPPEVWSGLFAGLGVTVIVAVILFFIFGIFQQIGLCRLAKYDSFGEAFSFGKIFEDIKEIGVLRLIGFLIVLAIIIFILGFIISLIGSIPYVGLLIVALICSPFILLFSNRALGLLYSDL